MQTVRQVGGTIGLAIMGTVAAAAGLLLRRVSASDDPAGRVGPLPVTPGAHPALRAVAPGRMRSAG